MGLRGTGRKMCADGAQVAPGALVWGDLPPDGGQGCLSVAEPRPSSPRFTKGRAGGLAPNSRACGIGLLGKGKVVPGPSHQQQMTTDSNYPSSGSRTPRHHRKVISLISDPAWFCDG